MTLRFVRCLLCIWNWLDIHACDYPLWLDAEGNLLSSGINLSASINVENLLEITYEQMISSGVIPEKMIMQMPDTLSTAADEINPGYQRLILTK